jgi:hypothetical protein
VLERLAVPLSTRSVAVDFAALVPTSAAPVRTFAVRPTGARASGASATKMLGYEEKLEM